jgi:hypothetical protein
VVLVWAAPGVITLVTVAPARGAPRLPANFPVNGVVAIEHRAVALPAKADDVPDFARRRVITLGAVAGIAVAGNAVTIDTPAIAFTAQVIALKTALDTLVPIGVPGALHHASVWIAIIGQWVWACAVLVLAWLLREDAPGVVLTGVLGTRVAVVAYDARTQIFPTNVLDADAATAFVRARREV